MKKIFGLFVFGLVMAIASVGSASLIQTGRVTLAEDDDYESLLKGEGNDDPTMTRNVEVGDFLLAIAEFPVFKDALTNSSYFQGDNTTVVLTAVELLKVASVDVDGDRATYTFEAPTEAEWISNTGLDPMAASGTMIMTYIDPPSAPGEHLDISTDLATGIASASEGPLFAEFGFRGEDGEFFIFDTDAGGADPTNIDDIRVQSDSDGFANLNVTYSSAIAPQMIKHNFIGDVLGIRTDLYTTGADLQLKVQLAAIPRGVWDLGTDADGYILAVPEPGTIAIWSVLGVAGLAIARRRRNKK